MAVGLGDLLQAVISGVLQGGFFALAAVGLSLIFGVQRILNVAQGAFIVLGAFVTIQFSILLSPVWHVDPLYSIFLDFFVLAGVGAITYFLLIRRIENTGFTAPLLVTFGLSIFLEYVISNGLIFGRFKIIPVIDPSYGNGATVQNQLYSTHSLIVSGIIMQDPEVIGFLIAMVTIPLLQLFMTRTYYGRAIRATSQDWQAAEFSGVDVRIPKALSFILGSGLAGLAGGVFAFTTPVVPTIGDTYLLSIILAVVILGGVGSVIGTLFGGLFVGIMISLGDFVALDILTKYSFPSDIGELITFLIFLFVLMVRPSGLFGVSLRK